LIYSKVTSRANFGPTQ